MIIYIMKDVRVCVCVYMYVCMYMSVCILMFFWSILGRLGALLHIVKQPLGLLKSSMR